MEKIIMNGGRPLVGDVEISSMKNAALAIIFGCLLVEDKCVLENLADIDDVHTALALLGEMGASIRMLTHGTYEIDCTDARFTSVSYDLVRKMRASYYLLGTELGRFGHAYVSSPGGCDFGSRPIDQHIKGFEALGAHTEFKGGFIDIETETEGKLEGASIFMDCVTVGGTINIMLAAATIPGLTVIDNAAREPHVVDLANFLNSCGAKISGAGTDVIKIRGVEKLHGTTYAVIPDMCEAGTFMVAAAATGGRLRINNVIPKHLESISAKLEEMGVEIEELDDAIIVSRHGPLTRANVKTAVYPGIPTDMNPQICVLQCLANGTSYLTENVYANRFQYIEELRRMGAQITVDGRMAVIEGSGRLSAARVKATDLRAGAAMVIAGLACEGKTEIEDIKYIERGYENIVGKLRAVGADIRYSNEPGVKKMEKVQG